VLAFLFAHLIVIPILLICRKYFGSEDTVRITALIFVTMVIAALIVAGIFGGLGLIPTGPRPTRADIFGSVRVDYKLALNILGLVIFAALFWLTAQRGASDPACGMKVDRHKAVTKELARESYYVLSDRCLHAFEAAPQHAHHAHLEQIAARWERRARGHILSLIPRRISQLFAG
jgi:YHS domain-containing protein